VRHQTLVLRACAEVLANLAGPGGLDGGLVGEFDGGREDGVGAAACSPVRRTWRWSRRRA